MAKSKNVNEQRAEAEEIDLAPAPGPEVELSAEYLAANITAYDVMQNHIGYYGPDKLRAAFEAGFAVAEALTDTNAG